jgi:hypothetical protein
MNHLFDPGRHSSSHEHAQSSSSSSWESGRKHYCARRNIMIKIFRSRPEYFYHDIFVRYHAIFWLSRHTHPILYHDITEYHDIHRYITQLSWYWWLSRQALSNLKTHFKIKKCEKIHFKCNTNSHKGFCLAAPRQ